MRWARSASRAVEVAFPAAMEEYVPIMGNFLQTVTIDWGGIEDASAYPFGIPAISSIRSLSFDAPITFFCGENGTGKSTLLEAIGIALGLNPEGGSKNYLFSTKDTHSELCNHLVLERSIFRPRDSYLVRSDTMFNLITETDALEDDRRYYEGKSLHQRSHGESILTLVSHRLGGEGLYILDEPETGLSQIGQIALLGELLRLVGQGSQLIVATHSPILLFAPDASLYQFTDEVCRIEPEESLEWVVAKQFAEDPAATIAKFLAE